MEKFLVKPFPPWRIRLMKWREPGCFTHNPTLFLKAEIPPPTIPSE